MLFNNNRLQAILDKRYEGTRERPQLEDEEGTFLMCFSDFRKIFNKLFVCIDFPDSFVGVRFADEWSENESGGIPVNNTEDEFLKWAQNPQYYMKLEKDSDVSISLLQKDGKILFYNFQEE